jgi:hypothetical protein
MPAGPIVNAIYQYLLIVSTLLVSWLGMMIVHEFGHCLHAWLSGGAVSQVVLHPLVISRTDCSVNPHPLFVSWGGPLWGSLIPLGILAVARCARSSAWHVFRFFAGFCLVINGMYVFEDAFFRVGDGGDMLRYGTPVWVMLAFGAVTVPLGFYLWNGLGPCFGLGEAKRKVNRRVAVSTFCVLVLIVTIEMLLGSR